MLAKKLTSAISSNTFVSKTKAALSYYASEMDGKINALYYVADTPMNTYENNEGGDKQKNKAHVIELLAAMSIIRFTNLGDDKINHATSKYYEFGIPTDASELTFMDFYDNTKKYFF